MCVCVSTPDFLTIQSSEGFIGLTLNAQKREIYGFDRLAEREGDAGRSGVKTGLFEAADLFITVLLLLTLTFE